MNAYVTLSVLQPVEKKLWSTSGILKIPYSFTPSAPHSLRVSRQLSLICY